MATMDGVFFRGKDKEKAQPRGPRRFSLSWFVEAILSDSIRNCKRRHAHRLSQHSTPAVTPARFPRTATPDAARSLGAASGPRKVRNGYTFCDSRAGLAERIKFKASTAGCRRQHVNPAYTSQTCPQCGYVDGANRKGDRFQCRYCGHEGHSDQVAAINRKARLDDREITPLTPKEKVKAILLERFDARVEGQRTTVPGRTSERGSSRTSPRQSKNETAAGKSTKPAVKEL